MFLGNRQSLSQFLLVGELCAAGAKASASNVLAVEKTLGRHGGGCDLHLRRLRQESEPFIGLENRTVGTYVPGIVFCRAQREQRNKENSDEN